MWVLTVRKARGNESDKRLKTQLILLGRILYFQALTSYLRLLLLKSFKRRNLTLSRSSDSVMTVLSMLLLVAIRPPAFFATRLVTHFQEVKNSRRSFSESLMSFTTRFRSKVSRHLSHAPPLSVFASSVYSCSYSSE